MRMRATELSFSIRANYLGNSMYGWLEYIFFTFGFLIQIIQSMHRHGLECLYGFIQIHGDPVTGNTTDKYVRGPPPSLAVSEVACRLR